MKKISIVLISFLLCPVAFAQALGTTKGYYSATQVDSMLWQTLFVATNSFDALGAAHNATNGYPWGSLYDTANAALNATNALGSAAWKSTSFFDLSGAGTTAATAATNAGNIMFTNALPALTNGFVTASITNGLQTTNVNLSQWSNIGTNQFAGTNFASSTANGILFSNDWSSFNNKQAALTYQPATNGGPVAVSQLPYAPQPASATLTNLSGITTNQIVFTNVNLSQWSNIGTNQFAGTNFGSAVAVNMTNAANQFTGTFTGLGSSLTNSLGQSFVGTNYGRTTVAAMTNMANSFTGTFTNGTFYGGGGGLTNLQVTNVTGLGSAATNSASAFQPATANLTNWSNIGTNQFLGTNALPVQGTNLANGGSSVGQILTATASGVTWSNAPTALRGTFTFSSLTNGVLTITHNLNLTAPFTVSATIFNNSYQQIRPDNVTGSANSVQVDITSYTNMMTGTWGWKVF